MIDDGPSDWRCDLEALAREFRDAGFVILPDALSSEEVQNLRGVLEGLDQSTTANTSRRPRQPGDVLELRNCVARDRAFLELVDRSDMIEFLGVLLGFNIQLGNSHCFIRPPFARGVSTRDQLGNSWHHDLVNTAVPVNGRLPHLATRVGYFLTSLLEPESGSIYVVPGSHRYSGRPPFNPVTKEPYGSLELLVDAGTAIVFDNRLWHATAPNYSQESRMNIYLEYSPRWMRPFDYYAYGPELLDGASPVRKQLLGFDFSSIEDGDLGYQQPKDIDVPLREWLKVRGRDVPPLVPE